MCIDEGDTVLVVITVATQTSQPNSLLCQFQLWPNRLLCYALDLDLLGAAKK